MADSKEKAAIEKGIDYEGERSNSLSFDDKVIKKIVGFAANEISGILPVSGNLLTGITDILRSSDDPTKGITVEVGKKQVAIDIKAVCEYGLNIPRIFQNVVDRVSEVIKEMTGLDVVEVNIHVYDVLSKEDFERQSRRKLEEKVEIKNEILVEEGSVHELLEENDIAIDEVEDFEDSTEESLFTHKVE